MSQQTINTPRDTTLKTTEQTPRNIADVLADELSGIAQALGGSTDYDDLTHRPEINSVTLTGDKSSGDLGLAGQEDLTNIVATGTTNATGATIPKGTYFYLNDDLCQAKEDIASGATFTLNTNYEEVTAGGLNALNSNKQSKLSVETTDWISINTTNIITTDVSKTGKSAIGVVGYSRDGQTAMPYIMNISIANQTVRMAFPSAGGTIQVYVLYEANA